ncbi:MAG: hypothetical protein C0518_12170 [Opitutus sp.]|nr:hypothetical protein [Opitutus sp.]
MRLSHFLALAAVVVVLRADPLSKSLEIDFFREVPNRNLKALAVRSDGRVLAGPTQRELPGKIPADLLWSIAATTDARAWLIGTGPEARVFHVNTAGPSDFEVAEAIDLEATHVFAVCPIDDATFLAGTSPQGTVTLVRSGKIVASVTLPADSIFDFALVGGKASAVLIATGNPGRIYRLELAQFEKSGETKGKLTTDELAKVGITTFGEIRDRNVRRLLPLADGRVIAGSAPKGNVYAFPATGGAPLLLLENREAEVTDLLADAEGSFFAAITLSGTPGESRVNRPPTVIVTASPPTDAPDSDSTKNERFAGRGQLIHFPAGGLPETVVSRSNTAFYRLAWHDDTVAKWVLISGGEQGELLAYAPAERRSINLGASASAQVNAILPSQPQARGQFHLMRNNPAGLSQLDFSAAGERSLETRKIDLGVAAEIGQVRFAQISGPAENLRIALRTSFGSDELEGWSDWTALQPLDGGWFAPDLRGRYVQLRVAHPQKDLTALTVDKATLFYLPQNRRPQLSDFRIFPANLGLVPVGEPNPAVTTTTLGQLLFPNQRDGKDELGAKRKGGLLNSPIVPSPGAQIIYWTVTDADDDNLAATFAITPEDKDDWTDLAVNTSDSFVQFDVSHLPEGRYRSRLAVREQAPRPEAQRLSYTFETDVLTVDRTAPAILAAQAEHAGSAWRISIEGADALSLLEGAEFKLNNGARVTLEHPVDGILDSRREAFVAEFTDARAAGANSVEVTLYDKSGNSASRRLPLR